MKPIEAPIDQKSPKASIANLQEALLLLLEKGSLLVPDDERLKLKERLRLESEGQVYGTGTGKVIDLFRQQFKLEPGEIVDEPTAKELNKLLQELGVFEHVQSNDFLITGIVEFKDGSHRAGLRVDVFDRDLGSNRVHLGDKEQSAITAENGTFLPIHYQARDFEEGEGRTGPNADLVFEVTAADDQSALEILSLYRRITIAGESIETRVPDLVQGFEAAPVEDVRIVLVGRPLDGGLSEYDRLMRDLKPLLLNGATPADFDQERFRDIDFSARETGWDRTLIETMTFAWQLARTASREPQLLAETFYGLLRYGPPTEVAALPANLPELLDKDMKWELKLEDSLAHRIIGGELQQHLERMRSLRTESTLRAGDGRRGSIGDVLAHAGMAEEQQREFLSTYHAHDGTIEEFWRTVIPQRLGWTEEKISEIQTSLQFADILGYDMPLVKQLKDKGFTSPRDLAQLDRRDWIELLTQVGPPPDAPGDTPEIQIARTLDGIIGLVEATYPTEIIARIALTSSDPKLADARDLLTRFFEREMATEEGSGFDMRRSPVTKYLEEHSERVFQGLESNDRELLTSQLQRLQRVYRLGVDRAQTEALLALDLDSAFHITRFSLEHFVSEFAEQLGGAQKAALAYGRAEKIAGTVLYMYTDMWQGTHGVEPMAIMSGSQPQKNPAKIAQDTTEKDMVNKTASQEKIPELKEPPKYRDLFGSAKLCECGHCQSFYSPAAYFVDLLHMLDQPKLGVAMNPVEVLFRRRPDLAHIQLTCENTNTLIPYVDLVTEVLESFVANRAPKAFNVPPGPPNRRLPSPSADELRVNPVYLTTASLTFADEAYAALQEAVFPLPLPLNLSLETTRVYLDHLGTSRAELMTLFDRDPGFEALMARAAEILLLSPEEFEIIAGAMFGSASSHRPATTAEFFGLSMTGDPTTLFNHAAPEFFRNTATPDERNALIRSVQNVLSLISPLPIPDKEWGSFDTFTEAAVNAFLNKKGIIQNGRTDAVFWGALEADGMQSLSVMVCPVPMFLDRSGLTYAELVALVKTRFVNPMLQGDGDLDFLARLGIPAADIRAWIQAGLPVIPAPIQMKLTAAGEDPIAFTTWVKRRVRAVVLNTGFEAPCDLDRATLMHLDGTLLSPEELVTLFRFIRLWRKLGWNLEDLDHVVEPGSLEHAAIFQTLLLLANVKQLRDQLNAPIADLVSLWQKIPTHGEQSLYDRLFRNRAAQLIDPILELNRERTELKAAKSATPPALSDHVGSILAAFRLSAQELAAVREAIGLNDDPALPPANHPQLTLDSLSAIYREVALARALQISVRELLVLIDLSSLAVFERPDKYPRGDALAFVAFVGKVRASGLKVSALDYLCRAVPQPPGLPGTQRDAWRQMLASILDGLHAIAAEEPIEDDPAGEKLTARLTALLGPDDARTTTALIYGRDSYTAKLAGLPESFPFPAAVSHKVVNDSVHKQLVYRGAMMAADRGALLLAAPVVPPALNVDYTKAVKALDAQPRAFVARALRSIYSPAEAEAAQIEVSSLDVAGAPISSVIDKKIEDVLTRRRTVLSRSLIKQTLTTATGLTADIVGLLLENEKVLTSMSGAGPAIDDYQKIDGDGLDAEYFANPDLKGAAILQRTEETVGFDLQGAVPAPGVPAIGFSVRWTGSLYMPAAGEVTFHVRCSDGVRVMVNGAHVIDEWHDHSETEFNATHRLDGRQFYPIEVDYYNKTGDALLELSWSSPSIPAAIIPQASFYTEARFEALLQRVERIYKFALLLEPFNLTAHDVRLLAEHGDLKLDLMPLAGPVILSAAQAMFQQWVALHDFAALRDRYQSSEATLIDVPIAASPSEALKRFATLTGSTGDTLDAIVEAFTIPVFDAGAGKWTKEAPDLTRLSWWEHIADALALVQRTGAAPEQLLAWAKTREIRQLPTGPETLWFTWTALDKDGNDRRADNSRLAQESKNLVRSRYDEKRWHDVGASLNDVLRIRRRSALTGFVLAMPEMMHARVSDTGRLFEFLLIDVEMDPCMETSRIKQGISSVQLFVQRVLLNLESPLVPPARVDRGRWKWMKIYRVWEANRKVFLYPESYLEEELRDDKTPIFKELESELLQDELNEPNAERAFRHYLEKLDDIKKLIVCGTCVDSEAGALHVFARTSTAPFVFYHRWLDNKNGLSWTEGVWSPWQKLPVDVATIDDGEDSGAHLMPIAWNRRLYLFWPVFEQKPDETLNASLPEGFDRINCWYIKLAWSEYKDGRWSSKQTGVPFVVSPAFVDRNIQPELSFDHFTPNHRTIITITTDFSIKFNNPLKKPLSPLGLSSDSHVSVKHEPFEHIITDKEDPKLSGTKLEQEGDFADHGHFEYNITVLSLMPKPSDHYLDAQISGSQLTLRVFCRFQGIPIGQVRNIIGDKIIVVRDGNRTDREERSQNDFPSIGEKQHEFKQVGTFHFPTCTSELDAKSNLLSLPYNSLERPQDTVNSFMALRDDWLRVSGLRLATGASPILGAVPTRFNVIDSDNRSGFDRRGPFFYQDQQRCYLVTREAYYSLLEPSLLEQKFHVLPDARPTIAKFATDMATMEDRHMGFAPEASLRVNPWAHAALVKWAAGPGLPATLRSDEPPVMHTLSGSLTGKSVILSDAVKDQFDKFSFLLHPEYTFTPHWHPYTCPFITALNSGGLPALFTLDNQSLSDMNLVLIAQGIGMLRSKFETTYKPDPDQVVRPYPLEEVDFSRTGSYSKYNWEIFFHAPMTVATAYSRAGKYEDALRWFHFVFDPMTGDADTSKKRFWRFLPFRTADSMRIEETLDLLTYSDSDPVKLKQKANLEASIQEWLDNPFNPHIIARRRPVVYMNSVFMQYLDNLIAWADELFLRDTIESINEATQFYVLAANLLGPRPQPTPAPGSFTPETYQSLRLRLDALSNLQVDLETRLPFTQIFGPGTGTIGQLTKLPQTLYFCLPQNDRMLAYWDTIADRLFKIRHCMSLDGTVRQLPLFEPPINPMILVEAVRHGLDIGSVLNDLYAPLPRSRFSFKIQQAFAMCNEVRSLGSTLLSVLEKRDAEKLSVLRSEHETQLLDQVKANKKLQIDEAEQARQALEETARMTTARIEYYENLIAQGLISEETDQLGNLDASDRWQETASWIEAEAQALNLIPNISTGQNNDTTFGGSNLGAAASAVGRAHSYQSATHSYKASRASITGGHTRRAEEWRFQRDQAKREKSQVERQQAAARIRKAIAEAELRNHEMAIEHSRSIEEQLRTKFTNEGLYGWMEGQLRTVYFQCYKMAYEMARGAQRSFQYQLGTDASFVRYGAWDSSVRGLLAGEQLYLQLKQMESAYLEQQTREFEITKHVSVLQLDPLALITLKETGECEVDIPEWLFDLDYPGHYFRRLKTVSITIPAVVGPYTSVSATVTLLSSKVRESARIAGIYGDDENYRPDHLAVEAIAASNAQNDSGRFQLDFRDEKYLPFEGAGAISRWRIELPHKFRSFDYDTISDVVLHLKYTARRDEMLARPALEALEKKLDTAGGGTLLRLFSLRHEFPNEWHKLLLKDGTRTATFTIAKGRLTQLVQGRSVNVIELHYALILKESRPAVGYKATLTPAAGNPIDLEWAGPGRYRSGAQEVSIPIVANTEDSGWEFKITAPVKTADLDQIQDILIVTRYSVAELPQV